MSNTTEIEQCEKIKNDKNTRSIAKYVLGVYIDSLKEVLENDN